MSTLITGGAGFIGSHLAAFYTSGGQPVTVLDNLSSGKRSNFVDPEGVTLIEGDVADAALVARAVADAEMVYHLAAVASVAECIKNPEAAYRTNVAGTQAVFDAVAKAQAATGRVIPVVYASSAAVYGDSTDLPLSETAQTKPLSPYGEHKLENERIAARAFAEHGVRSVGLRFFNVYGPRQDPSSPYSGVISIFIDRAQKGQNLTIFGDGEQSRDFIYVRDVVNCMRNAAAWAQGSVWTVVLPSGADVLNVATGTATNLKLLARTIGTVLGKQELTLDYLPARDGDIRHSLGNPYAVMETFNIVHWTPLLYGLQEMLVPDA